MDKPKWTAQDYRDIAHKSAGPYSAAVHICSVEMLQHAADLLDRITALESDAVAQAGEIERLKARIENKDSLYDLLETSHNELARQLTEAKAAATRQPLREMPEGMQANERVITCACGTKYKLQIFAGGGGGEPGSGYTSPDTGYTSPDTGYVASENTCIAPAGKPEMPEAGSRSCGCDCPKKHCVPTAVESHCSPRGGEGEGGAGGHKEKS